MALYMSLRAIAWQSRIDLYKRDCHIAIAPRNYIFVLNYFNKTLVAP
jgi:hypothetical protein